MSGAVRWGRAASRRRARRATTPRRRWSGRAVLAALMACAVVVGCGRPLNERECGLLLDRYTEKLIQNEQPHASIQFIHAKQQEARELAQREPRYEFDACASKVSREQYQCAMQAPDVDQIERCLAL